MKNFHISNLFPLIIMIMLAALAYWLKQASEADTPANSVKRHDPDYIVENFVVRRFNPLGNLQHTLRAPKMLHYPDDDTTTVESPDLVYHGNRPTHVTANMGWTNKDGKEVRLSGNVHVQHAGIGTALPTEIQTELLYVYPDDEIARTDEPVVITQGQTVIHGTGLDASNKTKIANLKGRVQGTIYPKPK